MYWRKRDPRPNRAVAPAVFPAAEISIAKPRLQLIEKLQAVRDIRVMAPA